MNKKILALAIVLVVVLVGAGVAYRSLTADTGTQMKQSQEVPGLQGGKTAKRQAPEFSVLDAEGKQVSLSSLRGKPVVLNFWASWCGPCREEMPDFQQVYTLYQGRVHFMMVNLTDGSRETQGKAAEFVRRNGFSFPVYYDTKQEAVKGYGITAIPTTFILDADGMVVSQSQGVLHKEALQKTLEQVLAK